MVMVVALLAGMATMIGTTAAPAAAAPVVVTSGVVADQFLSFDSGSWTVGGPPPLIVGVAFAPSGQIFAADKLGRVLVFDGPGDTSPAVSLDIRGEVNDFHDRGLLGITLDPNFSSNHTVYIVYTYDKDPFGNGAVPAWGTAAGYDSCGDPGIDPGCVVSARVSKFVVGVNGIGVPTNTQAEQVIFPTSSANGWCNQFSSHSIGTIAFGADGKLYIGAGEGASFANNDWGQFDTTNPQGVANPCKDPPAARGGTMIRAQAEGGSMRSQSARSTVSDGYSPLDGAIIRINTDGTVPNDNPLVANGVPGDDPIVAFGFRNPYRFSIKPFTNELWIGDVGNGAFEEINRFTESSSAVPNFGWPCFEGRTSSTSGFSDYPLCRAYEADLANGAPEAIGTKNVGQPTYPYLTLAHDNYSPLPPLTDCKIQAGSGIIGGSFVTSGAWPGSLQGAYIYGDYARSCLWAVPAASQGNPSTASLVQLATNINPVQIVNGPGGNIYVVDLPSDGPGGLYRFTGGGPSAVISVANANVAVGADVQLTASSSTGNSLTFDWDLNGNGVYREPGDATGVTATARFATPGQRAIGLRVTDAGGRTSFATTTVQIGGVPVINALSSPAEAAGWAAGDRIDYTADASDPNGGALSYRWNVVLKHCTPDSSGSVCHEHVNVVGALPDAPSGSFVAPGHEWRTILRVELTVTNGYGLSATRSMEVAARGQLLTILTDPPGITVSFADRVSVSPFSAMGTEGEELDVSVPASQTVGGKTYIFAGWADAPTENSQRTVVLRSPLTLTALFSEVGGFNPIGPVRVLDTRDGTGTAPGKVADGGLVRLVLTAANGVPANATAVMLNLTATEPVGPGYATAYPCDIPRPLASNVNYAIGETAANLVQVRLASDGSVCLFTQRSSHLIVDLAGYFAPTGQQYRPVDPTRVLDTRVGLGAPEAKVGPDRQITLDLSSVAPPGASAVVLNLTGTENLWGSGYVSAFPCGATRPLVSNLNSRLYDTRPNLAVVPLGPGATVCLYSQAQIDLVADLAGWYVPKASEVSTQNPLRVLDTRENIGAPGPVLGNSTITLDLDRYAPLGATAVVMNVTSVEQSADGYVTVWPCGARPLASNLNGLVHDTRPNLVVVRLSAARTVCLYSQQTTNLVADLAGWTLG